MDFSWIEITSSQNPQIKEVVKLRTERQRKKQQRILVDGVREISRAAAAGFELESLFVCEERSAEYLDDSFWSKVHPRRGYHVSPEVFPKIAFGDRNEGVVAVFVEKQIQLSDLSLGTSPLILVLDGIEKPGNVGAVFRTASAAGVDAVILTNAFCHPFNPNAVRASLGTVFELPFVVETVPAVTGFFEERQIRVVTTRVDTEVDYTGVDYAQPIAVVLGSEAHGVSQPWREFDGVTIPMTRSVDSLNISATAAIIAFEARRQRSL